MWAAFKVLTLYKKTFLYLWSLPTAPDHHRDVTESDEIISGDVSGLARLHLQRFMMQRPQMKLIKWLSLLVFPSHGGNVQEPNARVYGSPEHPVLIAHELIPRGVFIRSRSDGNWDGKNRGYPRERLGNSGRGGNPILMLIGKGKKS